MKQNPNAWIKEKLAEIGITQKELCEILDITERSLYRKMMCEVEFGWDEIVVICRVLSLDNPLYYFASKSKILS